MIDQPHIPNDTERAAELVATKALVQLGLDMVARGAPGIPVDAIHEWLLSDQEQPFPKPVSR